MLFTQGQQVKDVITGTQGVVNEDNGDTDTVNISWEPNQHGGYISDHPRQHVEPNI